MRDVILVERRNTAVDHKSNRPEPSGAINVVPWFADLSDKTR